MTWRPSSSPTEMLLALRSRWITPAACAAASAEHVGSRISSIATGVEDIHAVPMKPSFAVTLNRADVVLLVGLEAGDVGVPAVRQPPRLRRLDLRGQVGVVGRVGGELRLPLGACLGAAPADPGGEVLLDPLGDEELGVLGPTVGALGLAHLLLAHALELFLVTQQHEHVLHANSSRIERPRWPRSLR